MPRLSSIPKPYAKSGQLVVISFIICIANQSISTVARGKEKIDKR